MGLSEYKVAAGFAVSDMERARGFYEGKLGLPVGTDSGDNVAYLCGEGSVVHVYLSPEHAGRSTATLAGWYVDDIEGVVDELTSGGVVFERYDEGPIVTDEKGIAAFEGGAKVAYFKDPDGNTLSIAQKPRSREEVVDKGPVTEQSYLAEDATPAPWAEARGRLAEADTYWLATVRPDGRPHVVPVLAVWLDGALHFSTGETSRKGKNLARNSHCVIAVGSHALDLVVEGEAAKVSDEAGLRRVADAYASKYGWPVTVRDGAFYGDGAPTAGPPPYEVYEVIPRTAFGFPTDETFGPTRWRF